MKYDSTNSRNIGGAGSPSRQSDETSSSKTHSETIDKTREQTRNWAWANGTNIYDWMDSHSLPPTSDNS
ncbi:hypothetical protein [Paraburkholderia sp. BL10I2N1]|uniref:hypothetical protein n=1 Tax=Paraburkholderia sp. BL10I2N1 TaxID=1938796 RepID=UPI00105FA7A0|nr:hypothetical protein [Paraburkholderia sp. BL10I2N1]